MAFTCTCGCITKAFTLTFVQTKGVHVVWYNYTELHVLLWLDILQSATEQKDVVAGFFRNGVLSVEVARGFGDHCCKAIEKASLQQWKADVCNWTEDEMKDRLLRLVQ